MRRLLLVPAVLLIVQPLTAQEPFPTLRIHSCARADSVLGPAGAVPRGKVRGRFDSVSNSTILVAGARSPDRFYINTAMAEHGPVDRPAAELSITLRHQQSEAVLRGGLRPVVTLLVDDTTHELSPVLVGTYDGPRFVMQLPISAALDARDMLAIARARTVAVRIDSVTIRMSEADRRAVGTVYIAMLCGVSP